MIILNQDFANRHIKIEPYDNSSDELITYDLRVGRTYQEPGVAESYEMPDKYLLKPGACILVATEETLYIPHNIFGQLCSKGSLTALGLMVDNTKVDPLFTGHLKISVFNASARPLDIKRGLRFCSVFFQTIEHAIPNDVMRHAPQMTIQKKSAIKEFYESNKAHIIG